MAVTDEDVFRVDSAREYGASLSISGMELATGEKHLTAIYHSRLGGIRQNSLARRTELTLRGARLQDDVDTMRRDLDSLHADHARLTGLQTLQQEYSATISRLDADIRKARYETERKRMEDEFSIIDSQEKIAVDRVGSPRLEQARRDLEWWQQNEQWRNEREKQLAAERTEVVDQLKTAEKRLGDLEEPLVTRTVAGFLLWVGYGAIAATGAAVAVILGGDVKKTDELLALVIAAWAQLLTKVPLWCLWFLPVILAVLAAGIGGLFWLADKVVHRFDGRWRDRRTDSTKSAGGLMTFDLSRQSYVRALAALPFLYVIGLAVSLICVANVAQPKSTQSFHTSVSNTLTGSAIALLTVSVLVLWIIKAVQRRIAAGAGRTWRDSWEIAAVMILLGVSIITAVVVNEPSRRMWASVAVFMLAAGIALSYGIIYRGLFRDVDHFRWLRRSIDSARHELTLPPTLEPAGRAERAALLDIERAYRHQRQSLQNAERERSLRRLLGIDDADDGEIVEKWIADQRHSIRKQRNTPRPRTVYRRVLDADAAPAQTAERSRIDALKDGIEVEIKLLKEATERRSGRVTEEALSKVREELTICAIETAKLAAEEKASIALLAEHYHRALAELGIAFQTASLAREATADINRRIHRVNRPRPVGGSAEAIA